MDCFKLNPQGLTTIDAIPMNSLASPRLMVVRTMFSEPTIILSTHSENYAEDEVRQMVADMQTWLAGLDAVRQLAVVQAAA